MLEAKIIYVSGNDSSIRLAEESETSFSNFEGWIPNLRAGITPKKYKEPLRMKWIENGRMESHISRVDKYPDEEASLLRMIEVKKSCALNHVRFWQEIVKQNKTMAFIEHDSICVREWTDPEFEDCLILNMQDVFSDGQTLERYWRHAPRKTEPGIYELEESYPILYTYENEYKGSDRIPGTAAYAMTPQGAKKMLDGVKKYGLDQDSYMINSRLVKLEYIFPSVVKFNPSTVQPKFSDGTRLP